MPWRQVPPGVRHFFRSVAAWKPKDLINTPYLVAEALRASGWYLREEIIWAKPSPMPESVEDRCTRAHEQVFRLMKAATYYHDAVAIQEPLAEGSVERYAYTFGGAKSEHLLATDKSTAVVGMRVPPGGRNKRSVWTIGPEPYSGAHFATMPTMLAETCIKAGSSAKGVCRQCGAPWERAVRKRERYASNGSKGGRTAEEINASGKWRYGGAAVNEDLKRGPMTELATLGWTPTCRCRNQRGQVIPATVLDPFGGAGTTALVAWRLGRAAISIDASAEYVALQEKRLAGQAPLFA